MFRNCNDTCARVAVGHALRAHSAVFGYLNQPELEMKPRVETSKSFLKKKTKIFYEGFVTPRWKLVTANGVITAGEPIQNFVCVGGSPLIKVNGYGVGCTDPARMAIAGATFSDFTLDGAYAERQMIYNPPPDVKEAWNIAVISIVVGALTLGAGALFAGGLNAFASFAANAVGVQMGTAAVSASVIGSVAAGYTLIASGGSLNASHARPFMAHDEIYPPNNANAHVGGLKDAASAAMTETAQDSTSVNGVSAVHGQNSFTRDNHVDTSRKE